MIKYFIAICLIAFSCGAASKLPLQKPKGDVSEPLTLEGLQANLSDLWNKVNNIQRSLNNHIHPTWLHELPGEHLVGGGDHDHVHHGHTGEHLVGGGDHDHVHHGHTGEHLIGGGDHDHVHHSHTDEHLIGEGDHDHVHHGHTGEHLIGGGDHDYIHHGHAGEPLIGGGQHDYVRHIYVGNEASHVVRNSTDSEGSGDGQNELNGTQSSGGKHPSYVDHNGRRYYLGALPSPDEDKGHFANVSAHDGHTHYRVYVPIYGHSHHYHGHAHGKPEHQDFVSPMYRKCGTCPNNSKRPFLLKPSLPHYDHDGHHHHHHTYHDGHYHHDQYRRVHHSQIPLTSPQPNQSSLNRSVLATCQLKPNSEVPESRAEGAIVIYKEGDNNDLHFEIRVGDLPINQGDVDRKHGFHIHENAIVGSKCSSAGGHYNPTKQNHGSPSASVRHVGDLGNVPVLSNQSMIQVIITDNIAKVDGPSSIIGKSIVLHEKEDDLGLGGNEESLKTGNAGRRLACCTIESHETQTRIRFNG